MRNGRLARDPKEGNITENARGVMSEELVPQEVPSGCNPRLRGVLASPGRLRLEECLLFAHTSLPHQLSVTPPFGY